MFVAHGGPFHLQRQSRRGDATNRAGRRQLLSIDARGEGSLAAELLVVAFATRAGAARVGSSRRDAHSPVLRGRRCLFTESMSGSEALPPPPSPRSGGGRSGRSSRSRTTAASRRRPSRSGRRRYSGYRAVHLQSGPPGSATSCRRSPRGSAESTDAGAVRRRIDAAPRFRNDGLALEAQLEFVRLHLEARPLDRDAARAHRRVDALAARADLTRAAVGIFLALLGPADVRVAADRRRRDARAHLAARARIGATRQSWPQHCSPGSGTPSSQVKRRGTRRRRCRTPAPIGRGVPSMPTAALRSTCRRRWPGSSPEVEIDAGSDEVVRRRREDRVRVVPERLPSAKSITVVPPFSVKRSIRLL